MKRLHVRQLAGGLWLAVIVALAGCSFPSPAPRPAAGIYRLDALPAAPVSQGQAKGTIQLGMLEAAPGFDTSRMAYLRTPFHIEYFANHRWTDTPAHMLYPLLSRALEQSGAFQAVLPVGAPVSATRRLSCDDLQLLQRFTDGKSDIELSLRASLYDLPHNRLIASRRFRVSVPADPDPVSGIAAANKATAQLLGEVVQFVKVENEK